MKNIVLITRPEQSAAQTAYAVNQKNYQTFCEAFLDVVFHDVTVPDLEEYGALVFTSANAVQAFILKSDRRDILAYCVGEQTLMAVRHAGFDRYKSAKGKVSDLIQMLGKEEIDRKILYCRARDIAHPLEVENKEIAEIILYHTEKSEEISKNCLNLLTKSAFSHVLFYSARTAENFTALIQKYQLENSLNQCEALCLGDSMIKCIENLQWKHIKVATTPDPMGMLQLLEKENE